MMRVFPGCLALAILLGGASPTSAQIISTIIPKPPEPAAGAQPVSGEWLTGLHVMAGASSWEFGYTRVEIEQKTRNGFIGAVDFGTRVSPSVTVGGGGWYNGTSEYSVDGWSTSDPFAKSDITYRFKRSMFSIYGSVFYKAVGIQAGIVPVRVKETVVVKATGASASDDDGGQIDTTVFGVVRFGPEWDDFLKLSFAAGFGVHRFGARDANAGVGISPPSPSSVAMTSFGNFAFHLFKGLSVDLSVWWSFGDEAGDVTGVGNRSQTRSTVGIGYQF